MDFHKEKIFEDFEKHLLEDNKPSDYFNSLIPKGIYHNYPLNLLGDLIGVEQESKHHPEGNVWIHTMMVVDKAAELRQLSKNTRVFMWAALLHDLGKARTTKLRKGKITAYDHDIVGKDLAIEFLSFFTEDKDFIITVAAMVRWHMQTLFVVKDMPFAKIEEMLKEVSVDEIALLSKSDRLGRGNLTTEKFKEEEKNIRIFLEKVKLHLQ